MEYILGLFERSSNGDTKDVASVFTGIMLQRITSTTSEVREPFTSLIIEPGSKNVQAALDKYMSRNCIRSGVFRETWLTSIPEVLFVQIQRKGTTYKSMQALEINETLDLGRYLYPKDPVKRLAKRLF